jgi:glycosyltransferase involved in cell wall biosynthesis
MTRLMSPDVSVVIPTRDRAHLLAQTLRTVLAQDVPIEVVVVDEASSDGTSRWLAGLSDPRIRTIRHDVPRGLSAARNAGIELATGRWVAFVDDDDLWLPQKLSTQLRGAVAQQALWAYGGTFDITSEPRLLRVTLPSAADVPRLPWVNVVPGGGSNVVVDRGLLESAGGFDTSTPIVADWDLWIRLWQLSPPAVIAEPLMAYRIHAGNMSRKIDDMIRGLQAIDHRYRDIRSGAPLDWDDAYRWIGAGALRSGDRYAAVRMAVAAMRARHSGGFRRLVRALMPFPVRAPIAERPDTVGFFDRVRPPPELPWPPGIEDWLRTTLAAGGT